MRNLNSLASVATILALALAVTPSADAISATELDDFEDGTAQLWGAAFVQSVINRADGGPGGAGDNYLEYTSSGESGSNGRMVIPNADQWSGDYNAAGVTAIDFDAINLGDNPLHLRLVVRGGPNDLTSYGTASPIVIAPSTGWNSYRFELSAVELALLSNSPGSDSLDTVLSDVVEVRILSAVNEPTIGSVGARGDVIAATIGLDNIAAVSIPEPASLAALGGMVVVSASRRRRR